jgi:uncharacterized protein (DUF169 family)
MSDLKEIAEAMENLLRLRTFPLGLKWLEKKEDLERFPKLKKLEHRLSFCQFCSVARSYGFSFGVTIDELAMPGCMWMLGLMPPPKEALNGSASEGIWMKDKPDAARYMQGLPRVPVGKYEAVVVSPLGAGKLDVPDLVYLFMNTAQMNLLLNALQWEDYERMRFFFSGEESCGDAIAECFNTGKPSMTVPCLGERRYGNVESDELEIAMTPDGFRKAMRGLEALRKSGTARYPINYFGPMADPIPEVTKYFPNIKEYLEKISKGESYD